jgi:hypothetical protein
MLKFLSDSATTVLTVEMLIAAILSYDGIKFKIAGITVSLVQVALSTLS